MLETEKLDNFARLLEEMTQPWTSHPKAAPLVIMRSLLKWFLIGLLALVPVLLGLSAWPQHPGITPSELQELRYAPLVFGWLFIAFLLVSPATFIAGFLYITWHREQLVPYFSPKNGLHRDAKFITRLLTFDKATLTYGLLQYRHRWSSAESRVALLIGDLRKLGLFPALAALIISAATLLKGDSNLFLWVPVLIVAIFYLMAFVALPSHERPQQVIQLLEYAIHHADQCDTTPSDANQ